MLPWLSAAPFLQSSDTLSWRRQPCAAAAITIQANQQHCAHLSIYCCTPVAAATTEAKQQHRPQLFTYCWTSIAGCRSGRARQAALPACALLHASTACSTSWRAGSSRAMTIWSAWLTTPRPPSMTGECCALSAQARSRMVCTGCCC